MKKTLVYDFPTRLFHWFFSFLFIGAFFIANVIDDDSPLFSYHMLMGFMMSFIVLLRLAWGIIGSRWARLTSFPLKPTALITYFKQAITDKTKRYAGHNPASSWAAISMFGLTLGLGFTGYMMSTGFHNDLFEEAHEVFAFTFMAIVVLHIGGISFHTLRHRDAIGMSMVHGKKEGTPAEHEIKNPRIISAVLFIALVILFGSFLYNNYDSKTQSLTLLNQTLQLGEAD